MLGSAESVGSHENLFEPIHSKARLFRRVDQMPSVTHLPFPRFSTLAMAHSTELSDTATSDNLGHLTDQLIQQNYAPAAVLVNAEGDILYFSGRTGKYLEPAAGRTNINIHAMAREGLRDALIGAIFKALKDNQPILIHGVHIQHESGSQYVDLVVQALERPEPLRGRVIIVFKDRPAPLASRRRSKLVAADTHQALLQELAQTRESLQISREEMQATVEELKSSNEELQSTNEEMQSTNEELTTSKEELQSLNEELQTVNAELQSKLDDLTWTRNDMSNLLNSTEIATVFLDNDLRLRRFTTDATKLFKLIPGDIGRPLAHVVTDLDYPQLSDDALAVQRTLVFQEKSVATHDGRAYRVRIMPYRTQDNVIDGIVITFIDITAIKQLESELRKHSDERAAS